MQCWGIMVAKTCTVARNISHAIVRRTPSKVMKIQELLYLLAYHTAAVEPCTATGMRCSNT